MKKVLITGGTGAIGQELVKTLSVQNKYDIYFTYAHSLKEANKIAKKFNSKPIQVIDSDISNLPNNFDIIINNAGYGAFGDLTHTVDDKLMREAFEINLMLPFKIIKLVLPHMMEQKWGRIVNISSIMGLAGFEYTVSYNSTKFALNGLTRTVAKEYAKHNITCNSVCPAAIGEKGMAITAAKFYSQDEKEFKEEIDAYSKVTPIGRTAKVSEIIPIILFLISNDASYINGVCLPIDGGRLA
jgi:NAD(P)-dependent dehydrogenase (short-subunit alcohol dehydrogenase family)